MLKPAVTCEVVGVHRADGLTGRFAKVWKACRMPGYPLMAPACCAVLASASAAWCAWISLHLEHVDFNAPALAPQNLHAPIPTPDLRIALDALDSQPS